MTLPRGIRNKNPGNIERSPKTPWRGTEDLPEDHPRYDKRFAVFNDPLYGLRAMMRLLIIYNKEKRDPDGNKITTLRQAINRWAPPFENNSTAYVDAVARFADINPDVEWDFTDRIFLVPVVKGMVIHENGYPDAEQKENGAHKYWYSNTQYEEAYQLAVKGRITSHTMNKVPEKKVPEVFTNPAPPSFWERAASFLKGRKPWKNLNN